MLELDKRSHAPLRGLDMQMRIGPGGLLDSMSGPGRAQITEILAEAQQPVPEQLRQYAQVAGGGGGGGAC